MTRAEFDIAVRNALRHYTRTDLLVGSPLLHTQIAAGTGGGPASVAKLQQVLADAAQAIFANARDQRLLRVLELTYFNPAPKQEAAAERLGLPFSTYRRHLISGIERMSEWLWHLEQEALHLEPVPAEATEARAPDRRTEQSELKAAAVDRRATVPQPDAGSKPRLPG